MAENLDVLNTTVSLLVRAVLLAARFSGHVRQRYLKRLALPPCVKHWSLTTLREKLVKIGAKLVRHSRCVVFQMAEVAVPRTLFREILDRIGRLRAGPELARAG